MRLLFVCKRHPQQRDLLDRPYGRFHHLPTELAARGHTVSVLVCSHRRLPSSIRTRADVEWSSDDVLTLGPVGLLRALRGRARAFGPDWVIGCSDAWFGPLAKRLARDTGARTAIDAYDNYEAYMPWNLPLHVAWRRALASAQLVTAAGPQLAGRLDRSRQGGQPSQVLPMAPDPDFVPRDRDSCRASLGLPVGAPLLGYVGSWTASRGTHLVLDVFERVRSKRPDARLVLSGRPPADALHTPGVINLGYLPDEQMPLLVSALDVAMIATADTAFGRYSYPAKLCEAMACALPVVATATPAIEWMLAGRDAHLAPVGDASTFAERVLGLLDHPVVDYPAPPRWPEVAAQLERLLVTYGAPRQGLQDTAHGCVERRP